MADRYQWRFRVRSYEVGAEGQVHAAAYLNYLEEMAIQASEALGYHYDWYLQHQRMWLVRKLTLREFLPAQTDDDLILTTWISEIRRVQVNREYDLRRADDNAPILRARHNWVFVNMDSMLPERFPPEFIDKFRAVGKVETLDTEVNDSVPVDNAREFVDARRVQHHELDQNGHVNNAVYINWVEQAITSALRSIGWTPQNLLTGDFRMRRIAREMEYFRSAFDDEPIRIITRLVEIGGERAAWLNEIRQADSNELIARDQTVFAFSDPTGTSCPPPDVLLSVLVDTHAP